MTRPPGLACRAVLPLHEPVDPTAPTPSLLEEVIAAKQSARPGQPVVVTILALSGGGRYGAFGAGFLAGWSEADNGGNAPIARDKIDIVTGISTGALLASFAAAGNLPASAGGSPELRKQADEAARAAYQVSDAGLFMRRSILAALTSNGLIDPRGLLAERVRGSVRTFSPYVARLPADHKVLVGAANLTIGKFYVADLREVAQNGPAAVDCYTEWLLASAAVPAAFPPRYIDGHGYVDGGVRVGAFLGDGVQRLVQRRTLNGDLPEDAAVRVNLLALFNNPISANNPARDAAAALRCDRSTLATAAADCPPVKNRFVDITVRSAGDIMSHQVYLDSVYRLQRELEAAGLLGISKFVYAAPARIAAEGCRATTKNQFDRDYMDCLYRIGFAIGRDPTQWQDFETVPRAARASERR